MTADPSPGKLPAVLTSHDLLKALAVVLMVVDHLGYYFFPHVLWLRIAGRLCVPVWFFLIGYSNRRDVPGNLIWMALILSISAPVAGQSFFPLNILFTLALARLVIDRVMVRALRSYSVLLSAVPFLVLLSFPGGLLLEYSTLGVMFAMLGYLRRHGDRLALSIWQLAGFTVMAGLGFVVTQWAVMSSITLFQLIVFTTGTGLILGLLLAFRPLQWPMHGPLLPVLHLLGRRTLEIYVIHLLVFRALAMVLYPARFPMFDFTWFHHPLLAMFGLG